MSITDSKCNTLSHQYSNCSRAQCRSLTQLLHRQPRTSECGSTDLGYSALNIYLNFVATCSKIVLHVTIYIYSIKKFSTNKYAKRSMIYLLNHDIRTPYVCIKITCIHLFLFTNTIVMEIKVIHSVFLSGGLVYHCKIHCYPFSFIVHRTPTLQIT